ncbi:MAG TPA: protein adenylyltransferase SelO family protein, partial [Coleofasciculaceae cyanobacterium]
HQWKIAYFNQLLQQSASALEEIQARLERYNPSTVPLRPLIEAAWEPIVETDDWSKFHDLVQQIQG